ncbi:hypothetical protein [Nitrososphaera viennensis]|uniref:Uncharacterized protein n=2 Tax=Nitrososphaera viennensis TaxID=1034015 RepID=A0A060HLW6_9ARCH|nr:hypothetical protein [Nitrososphaera viennensis]AIC16200.1 hypothetical protein NVIE_019420 [Nitrososphaera viennensis EN76]UVS68148.1 hypothetical protein NWT39_09580 [Nitrososphaera viennensis]
MSLVDSENNVSAKVLAEKDGSMYDRHKLIELGVAPGFLKFMDDEQARELLKGLLYLIIKKQDGYA